MSSVHEPVRFDGDTYEPALDRDRLRAQLARVRGVMADGRKRTLADLSRLTGDPEASVSARLRDLRKTRFGGFRVEKERIDGGLWAYWLVPPERLF